jgi:archaemetzincin
VKIYIQPLSVNRHSVEILANSLPNVFDAEINILPAFEASLRCYNVFRKQYNSTCLLRFMKPLRVTLGVTGKDIYAKGMNFLFGEAELNGSRAIISVFRLTTPNDNLYRERVVKEAVHEIGHVLGLIHCNNHCVMKFSNSVMEVDRKPISFCEDCASKIRRYLRF